MPPMGGSMNATLTQSRRSATQRAGQRRRHVGSDDDLFGRFLRRHFLGGRSWTGRRINEATVLDDFFDLGAVKGFVFEERFGDGFERGTMLRQDLHSGLVGVVDQL